MPSGDHCCVFGCTNRRQKNPDLSFHSFPRSNSLRREWIQAIRREVGKEFAIMANTVVCSIHFEESCFQPQLPTGAEMRRKCRRLKVDAVPRLFSFRPAPPPPRPSLSDRLVVCAVRAAEAAEKRWRLKEEGMSETERELQETGNELGRSEKRVATLEETVAVLRKEIAALQSQLFRFESIARDSKELEFLTGLSKERWDCP